MLNLISHMNLHDETKLLAKEKKKLSHVALNKKEIRIFCGISMKSIFINSLSLNFSPIVLVQR